MSFLENQCKKALEKIDELLKYEQDEEQIKKLLLDKEYIIKSFSSKKNDEKKLQSQHLNKHDAFKFVFSNKFNNINLKPINILFINRKKLSSLTREFMKKTRFKLYDTYNSIKSSECLKISRGSSCYLGMTFYINSLNENYIEIFKTGEIVDYSTFIHELGHARQNILGRDGNQKQCFRDAYPVFLELVYADWLKENNMLKESYDLKLLLLKQTKTLLNELQEKFYIYFNGKHRTDSNDYFFEYKYNLLNDIILAFYLYDMYLLEPKETIKKIDSFISNLKKLDEKELLKILKLDNSILNGDKIVYKLYEQLQFEKSNIKASRVKRK